MDYDVIQMTLLGLEETKSVFSPDRDSEELFFGEYLWEARHADQIYDDLLHNITCGKPNPFMYTSEQLESDAFHNKDHVIEMVFGIWQVPEWKASDAFYNRAVCWDVRKINLLKMCPDVVNYSDIE